MNTHSRILKFFVFLVVLLLSASLMAQVQSQSYNYLTDTKLGDATWLSRKNFDIQFYGGSDSTINRHLYEAFRFRKRGNLLKGAGIAAIFLSPPVGALGFAFGSKQYNRGLSHLQTATIQRYDHLLGGKTFNGDETFRRKDQASWYLKENFHVRYYDGQSLLWNNMLDEAYRWRNRANNQYKIGLGTNVGGMGLALIGVFALLLEQFEAAETLWTAGTVVHLSSYGFFISGLSKKRRAKRMLNQVSEGWFKQLNLKKSDTLKHLSD